MRWYTVGEARWGSTVYVSTSPADAHRKVEGIRVRIQHKEH